MSTRPRCTSTDRRAGPFFGLGAGRSVVQADDAAWNGKAQIKALACLDCGHVEVTASVTALGCIGPDAAYGNHGHLGSRDARQGSATRTAPRRVRATGQAVPAGCHFITPAAQFVP
jgi:hypothetical protein